MFCLFHYVHFVFCLVQSGVQFREVPEGDRKPCFSFDERRRRPGIPGLKWRVTKEGTKGTRDERSVGPKEGQRCFPVGTQVESRKRESYTRKTL